MSEFLNPGNVTLVFSGSTLGDFVQEFGSTFERQTAIAVRQNFWANNVILDGSFPAQVWRHNFVVYAERANRSLLIDFFMNLEDNIGPNAGPLTLASTPNTPTGFDTKSFGDCYFDAAGLDNPQSLLLFEAGFFTLGFIGNTKPS